MGSRMSGGEAWAIVDPSMNSTIEWTIDCGCTTTSMWWYGTSKRRCASITSSPLFTRVAEFVVTTRPMSQVGMSQRLGGRDIRERGARTAAEGSTGCRQHEPAHLGVLAGAQRLRDRRVLGVDGDDLAGPRDRGDQLTAHDQGLLVRERERAAGLERSERRAETDGPGDAVEHDVGIDIAHQLLGLVGAERGVLDLEVLGLRVEGGAVGAGGETDDLEAPRVGADHLESLGADRAGGSEDDDAAHEVMLVTSAATTLRTGRRGRARFSYCAAGAAPCAPRMSTTKTSVSPFRSVSLISPSP